MKEVAKSLGASDPQNGWRGKVGTPSLGMVVVMGNPVINQGHIELGISWVYPRMDDEIWLMKFG